jgi:hypothetical protein
MNKPPVSCREFPIITSPLHIILPGIQRRYYLITICFSKTPDACRTASSAIPLSLIRSRIPRPTITNSDATSFTAHTLNNLPNIGTRLHAKSPVSTRPSLRAFF